MSLIFKSRNFWEVIKSVKYIYTQSQMQAFYLKTWNYESGK